jgi:hypothetical protein
VQLVDPTRAAKRRRQMKVSEAFGGRFLKAADIQDVQPVLVTITNVDREEVESRDQKEKRVVYVLYTDRFEKGIIFKKLMARVLASAYGDDMDAWQGHPVELVTLDQEYGGEVFRVIRFRIPKSQKK